MKRLEEMNYFELLDLEAWCEKKIETLGEKGDLYIELQKRASAARNEIVINRCLEQFWAQKNIKENN
jgi:hypothetical protein